MCYSLGYNAPNLLPAGGLERGETDCVFGERDVARFEQHPSHRTQLGCSLPQAVKHSLALLRMGKKLLETY